MDSVEEFLPETSPRIRVRGVCLLATDLDASTGGVQRQSWQLLAELDARGVDTLACIRNYAGLASRESIRGTSIFRTPIRSRSGRIFNSLSYLVLGFLWMMRNRNRFDVIHCQQMFGSAMLGLLAKAFLRKPVLVRVTSTGDLGEVRQIHEMAFAALRKRQLNAVDRWVALTPAMREEILSMGVRPERISVIPNATRIPDCSATNREDKDGARASLKLAGAPVVVYTGRLSEEKGLDILLRAWPAVMEQWPAAQLLLLGDGGAYRNVEPLLRTLCAELNLEQSVHFLGHVPNVGEYLCAADLFVLLSRTEGMSNSLVEAMAAGVAIVASKIPANEALIDDGISGVLVPRDAASVSQAILTLLADDLQTTRIGSAARQKAEADLSVEKLVDRYLQQYMRIVAEAGFPRSGSFGKRQSRH